MSEDEMMVTIASAVGSAIFWSIWLVSGASMSNEYYGNGTLKKGSALAAAGVGLLLFVVLKLWASHDVRDDVGYLIQYWFMGAFFAALGGLVVSPIMGISYRHDVCENRNSAAAFAWVGALCGFTLAYAGSNIGDGPGWWVVVFCSALSCGLLILIWLLLELACHIAERVTVERDVGAGMRFGGLMIGMGIVSGRGAAGNWTGADGAIRDFLEVIVPALPLVVCAIVVELVLKPRPGAAWREIVLLGLLPGILFLLGGLFYVLILKPW